MIIESLSSTEVVVYRKKGQYLSPDDCCVLVHFNKLTLDDCRNALTALTRN